MRANAPPYLRRIDTSTSGRYDVTPLFADPVAFSALLDDLAAPLRTTPPALVAGIDTLGFVLGTGMAVQRLRVASFGNDRR